MRTLIVALSIVLFAATAGLVRAESAEECMIGDAALCLANPNCHWDGEKRGCYPGPAEYRDACAAHGDEAICNSDKSLGCKWSAEKKLCEMQAQ
jgi:hypothetical protein